MPKTAKTQYGWTARHDAALNLCVARFSTCPFGCAKDGAPNCAYHVQLVECEPAVQVIRKDLSHDRNHS